MSNKIIPSNIKNLSQLLDDGLILCDKLGAVISSNSIAQQFLNKNLNKKNISEFIKIDEFKNLAKLNRFSFDSLKIKLFNVDNLLDLYLKVVTFTKIDIASKLTTLTKINIQD